MIALIILAASLLIASPAIARTVSVKPHVTKRGVYVPPSYRTSPDKTKANNYSSKPNLNPFTGKSGKIDLYANPAPYGVQ